MGKAMVVVMLMLALLIAYLGLAHIFGWLDGSVIQRAMIVSASIFIVCSICSVLTGALKGKHS